MLNYCTSFWTFEANSVDFVHMRYLVGSIVNWDALFSEAYKVLAPGGYVESFEASPYVVADDGSLPSDAALAQWGPIYMKGGGNIGRTFRVLEDDLQRRGMEAAGFEDIQETEYKVPHGIWPEDPHQRQIGEMCMYSVTQDIEGYILFVANAVSWTPEQVMVYAAHLRREMRSGKYHTYFRVRIVHARKPRK